MHHQVERLLRRHSRGDTPFGRKNQEDRVGHQRGEGTLHRDQTHTSFSKIQAPGGRAAEGGPRAHRKP